MNALVLLFIATIFKKIDLFYISNYLQSPKPIRWWCDYLH